jgi:hypothetical protein
MSVLADIFYPRDFGGFERKRFSTPTPDFVNHRVRAPDLIGCLSKGRRLRPELLHQTPQYMQASEHFLLEAMGRGLPPDPNKKLRVDAVGPLGVTPSNLLKIESCDDGVTVWGWGGSRVTVSGDECDGLISPFIMRYSL